MRLCGCGSRSGGKLSPLSRQATSPQATPHIKPIKRFDPWPDGG
ncbi:hypothetical protein Thpro_020898 [Acidihalobacter prosperus]|uniref:Uncharacterized protein n=1 Tax=Acidihalobacter prosperus TaxID=160660 RepID=A0A1A6C5L0_9GAMM|nr:hypothetical protein Thpro_020898 [Acidihalobacter prosperus]